jgi:RNA polymerase sporulation-specific sigma factor
MSYNLNEMRLPKALPGEQQEQLLLALSTGDEESFEKLALHNLRLVGLVASKMSKSSKAKYGLEYDDLFSIGTIGLIKALRKYQIDKGVKFSTYAMRIITNEILIEFRSSSASKRDYSKLVSYETEVRTSMNDTEPVRIIDQLFSNESSALPDYEIECKVDIEEKLYILGLYLLNKSPLYTEVIKYYFSGRRGEYIAEMVGHSQSYVSRIISKISKDVQELRNRIYKRGDFGQFQFTPEQIEQAKHYITIEKFREWSQNSDSYYNKQGVI